jgi:phage regulator Rha-like protein
MFQDLPLVGASAPVALPAIQSRAFTVIALTRATPGSYLLDVQAEDGSLWDCELPFVAIWPDAGDRLIFSQQDRSTANGGAQYAHFQHWRGAKLLFEFDPLDYLPRRDCNAAPVRLPPVRFQSEPAMNDRLSTQLAQIDLNLAPIANTPADLTMSSREIAQLCDKNHKDVMRDIRNMLDELGETSAQFCANVPDAYGRPQPVFNLTKNLTLTLVAGYNVKLRKAIIDRWQQLEAAAAAQPPAYTLPTNYKEALVQLVEQVEKREAAESALALAAPSVAALERITAGQGSLTLTQAAKVLNMKVQTLIDELRARRWIYRRNASWEPYADKVTSGYAVEKYAHYTDDNTGTRMERPYCHLTHKGLVKVAKLLGKPLAATDLFSGVVQ